MDITNAIYAYGKAIEKMANWYMDYARVRDLKNNEEIIFKLQCSFDNLHLEVKRRKKILMNLLDKNQE